MNNSVILPNLKLFNATFLNNISNLLYMEVEINKALIEHVAEVARLKLTDKEVEKFSKELKDIIEAFSKLDQVDTEGIEPSLQPVELKNSLREDKAKKCFSNEEALSLTEHKKDGYFKGPKAI
jgi:aspartyl-tRNA(Asn)/glutamyl-tRNA(Gln) amidotransferase subunit C